MPGDRAIELDPGFQTDQRIATRLARLVEETRRDPFGGIGKPEPLKNAGPTSGHAA